MLSHQGVWGGDDLLVGKSQLRIKPQSLPLRVMKAAGRKES